MVEFPKVGKRIRRYRVIVDDCGVLGLFCYRLPFLPRGLSFDPKVTIKTGIKTGNIVYQESYSELLEMQFCADLIEKMPISSVVLFNNIRVSVIFI